LPVETANRPPPIRVSRWRRRLAAATVPLALFGLTGCQDEGAETDDVALSFPSSTATGSLTPSSAPASSPPRPATSPPSTASTTRPTTRRPSKPARTSTSGTGTAGWTRTFYDDFSGATLNTSVWGRYTGKPKNDSVSTWEPGQVFLRDGKLVLRSSYRNGKWITGGLGQEGSQQYGKWEVRYRMPKGTGVHYVSLLYPTGGGWPPEIDFAEDTGSGATKIMGVTHWGSTNHQIIKTKTADFSQWHTAGVILEPAKVSYLLDGRVWATVTGAEKSPSESMWLGIQTQVNNCNGTPCTHAGTPHTVDLEIDWVARYRHP
jgi:beta-glucanase (GH16 family)